MSNAFMKTARTKAAATRRTMPPPKRPERQARIARTSRRAARARAAMDMPARALGQPVADGLGLVRGVVVHDEMDVEVFGDRRFDLVQEATELLRAVAAIAFADDASGGDVERRSEERR